MEDCCERLSNTALALVAITLLQSPQSKIHTMARKMWGPLLFTLFLTTVSLSEEEVSVTQGAGEGGVEGEVPLVMVGILARNTEHTLENFFGYFENLDYPKNRMSVW